MQIRFRRGFDEETPIVRSEKLLSKKAPRLAISRMYFHMLTFFIISSS